MNIKAKTRILAGNLKEKWLRTLIASIGIVIGITCISITTSLSFGLLDTFTTAINSQYIARELDIVQTKKTAERGDIFVPKSLEDMEIIKAKYSQIEHLYPKNMSLQYVINLDPKLNCIENKKELETQVQTSGPNDQSYRKNLDNQEQKCLFDNANYESFEVLYEKNKKDWIGQTTTLKENETVFFYNNNNKKILEKQGINNLQKLLNTEIKVNITGIPLVYNTEQESFDYEDLLMEKPIEKKLKIVAIVDKTKSELSFMDRGVSQNAYFDINTYKEIIKSGKSKIPNSKIGFDSMSAVLKSYSQVDSTIEELKKDNLIGTSTILEVIKGTTWLFGILAVFLSSFGLIALLVSVFGIINVIAISVIERKREIGTLKALGTSNIDIFSLFIGEGIFIGVLGWFLASIFSTAILLLINFVVNNFVIPAFPEATSPLEALNIKSLNLTHPLWLYFVTLGIAIFFCVIASFIPSIGAARKDPVEALRNE